MSAAPILLSLFLAALCATAQTTEALITGRVLDSITGRPLPGARLDYENAALHHTGSASAGEGGRYTLLYLPPGSYRLRISAPGYQPQEVHELRLEVAARLDMAFRLRPLSDVWESGIHRSVFLPESGAVLPFYGPDVDTSRAGSFQAVRGVQGAPEPAVSDVIDPLRIGALPLAGRDVYTMLVTQAGVTADAATSRGLGLSVNGQRPSASNFMLDGAESNNYLLTGPLTAPAPEAAQEYRVSTANFSAEYGRTSGYLANAVTRAGGAAWHGVAYFNLKNTLLNAAGFQQNARGEGKTPLNESQSGFQLGGPLWRRSWFISAAFEMLRSRSRDSGGEYTLPTTEFVNYTAPASIARGLLERFPPPRVTNGYLPVSTVRLSPPVSFDRTLSLLRLDRAAGVHRFSGRFSAASGSRPDFIWTPYEDFVIGLEQRSFGLVLALTSTLRHDLGIETRLAWAGDRIEWPRAHPEIPTLGSFDGVVLPGSPAFYSFLNRGRGLECSESVTYGAGRHMLRLGGGFWLRTLSGSQPAGRDGRYLFLDFLDFAVDSPLFFSAPLARKALPQFVLPRYERDYRFAQGHLFAQDTVRLGSRWTLQAGLRWEHFGSPLNTGAEQDGVVDLDAGQVVFPAGGDRHVYRSAGSWAPRAGFAFRPRSSGNTVLRGAYGLFYDRPFDNLWLNLRNNNFVLPNFLALPGNYLRPVSEVLPDYQSQPYATDFPSVTAFDSPLANGYSQTAFLGLQQRWWESWTLEANGVMSLGRRLITTDVLNRRDGTHAAGLPLVSYRAPQGLSNYYALSALADYRGRRLLFRAVYTWSHSIDVQSEPLAGDFFDLSFIRAGRVGSRQSNAAFTELGNPRGDRASSDFDQRHNLVLYSVWDLPEALQGRRAGLLFKGWRFSLLSAFRSGFAYTVLAPSTGRFLNNRADIVGEPFLNEPVDGGRLLLNRGAFRAPPAGRTGNSGRNAFRGPGLYNIDVSFSRAFPLRALGENGCFRLRVDAYNVLNHANLNNPASLIGSADFGIALYGRNGREGGFPALIPFTESPRNIQLLLRIEF
jgi:hypothetical protein